MTTKTLAKWTGYADDAAVRDYAEQYNDSAGEGDKITLREAEERLMNDSFYWQHEWEGFVEYITELMAGRTLWRSDASGMGWRNLTGHREFYAGSGEDFLRAISPRDADCVYRVYKYRNGFRVIVSHHDAPTGEVHIVKPLKKLSEKSECYYCNTMTNYTLNAKGDVVCKNCA